MPNLYATILSLSEAKRYLRLESDFTEDDPDIERMIASALEYITKHTNYVFKVQNKDYYQNYECSTYVYDYPVNTTVFEPNIPLFFGGYIKFRNTPEVTLNVGFASKSDANFPTPLIDCALQMIKVWYYEAEKNVNTTLLPENVKQTIDTYRRCIIV